MTEYIDIKFYTWIR